MMTEHMSTNKTSETRVKSSMVMMATEGRKKQKKWK